jgi:hypothetical protein
LPVGRSTQKGGAVLTMFLRWLASCGRPCAALRFSSAVVAFQTGSMIMLLCTERTAPGEFTNQLK